MKYPRYLKTKLLHSFKVSPVTLLIGPRQVGKTTLMKEVGKELGMNYITFDTIRQLAAAQDDPEGFIEGVAKPVIIDEVQRVVEIALPIKLNVDRKREAGTYGLTGSSNPLVAPKLNDSLAGRMFILYMWPLSLGEIEKKESNFLKLIFDPTAQFSKQTYLSRKELVEVFIRGGYPEALALDSFSRDLWYDNLLTTIIERDVQDITKITRTKDIAKLLNILATRVSSLLNISELSRISAIPYTTLNYYMVILESLFLIIRQPAWHINRGKRLIKMPKLYFCDTGLLINQLGIDGKHILENSKLLGYILENFVFLELKKLISWSFNPIKLYHYHTQTGGEVDIILENRAGQIVGIEVKSSETIGSKDWKGLKLLEKDLGEKMVRGIILYMGKEVVALKKNFFAVPISALWD